MNHKLISFQQKGQPAMTKDADASVTISIPIAIKRRSGRTIVRSPGGVTANPNRVAHEITPLQLALIRGHRWLRMFCHAAFAKVRNGRSTSTTAAEL